MKLKINKGHLKETGEYAAITSILFPPAFPVIWLFYYFGLTNKGRPDEEVTVSFNPARVAFQDVRERQVHEYLSGLMQRARYGTPKYKQQARDTLVALGIEIVDD